ncbi:MAG: NAD(P)-dependent oxidoreductase [Planctomycetota bacterium]
MQRSVHRYAQLFSDTNLEIVCPEMTQVLSEAELMDLLPEFDGWIIGDDPATEQVFRAGVSGQLRAAVKWGVGVDNVDFEGARVCGLDISNTPGMFGDEVADIAVGYVIALARQTFLIDRGVKSGEWPKPIGISLRGKTAAVIGFGDIGQSAATRLLALGMKITAYDPNPESFVGFDGEYTKHNWPDGIEHADFLVLCCALNVHTHHILNSEILQRVKQGVRIVNISRGPLIDEDALVNALSDGSVHSAALEVFEHEPLPADSRLREFEQCVFGSHNASNTQEAVDRTSEFAVKLLTKQFETARASD